MKKQDVLPAYHHAFWTWYYNYTEKSGQMRIPATITSEKQTLVKVKQSLWKPIIGLWGSKRLRLPDF